MAVLIFKTNIDGERELRTLSPTLNEVDIQRWSIDLEDCDRVLRIVTDVLTVEDIESLVRALGFRCQELED